MAWKVVHDEYWGKLNSYSAHSDTFKFGAGEVGVISFECTFSGIIEIYSSGKLDVIGFFGTAGSFSGSEGIPTKGDYVEDDDSAGDGNFRIEYDVDSGVQYYLWFRPWDDDASGETTISVVTPEVEDDEPYIPDDSGAKLTVTADGTTITAKITGLDDNYTDVRLTEWDVFYYDSNNKKQYILDLYTIRSDETYSIGTYQKITLTSGDGIQPGVKYWVYASGYVYPDTSKKLSFGIAGNVTTPSSSENYTEPNIKIKAMSSSDGKSVTAYIASLNAKYPRDDRYIVWSLDGNQYGDIMYIEAYDSTSDNITFTGLTPGKKYTIGAAVWVVNNGSESYGGYTETSITTEDPSSNRPSEFSWTYEKKKGKPFNLTAEEWRDLLDNINAVRKYRGLSTFTKDTTGYALSYSNYYDYFTYPESGDDFLHKHYNQALNGITGMLGYGYSNNKKKSGDTVTADCLNLLVEMLNSIG